MKKKDLKTGMRVEFRNGDIYMVIKDTESICNGHQDFAFINFEGFMSGSVYTDDLMKSKYGETDYDVMKVYTIDDNKPECLLSCFILDFNRKHLIWERVKTKEMTLSEIEKELGYKIKIVDKK